MTFHILGYVLEPLNEFNTTFQVYKAIILIYIDNFVNYRIVY